MKIRSFLGCRTFEKVGEGLFNLGAVGLDTVIASRFPHFATWGLYISVDFDEPRRSPILHTLGLSFVGPNGILHDHDYREPFPTNTHMVGTSLAMDFSMRFDSLGWYRIDALIDDEPAASLRISVVSEEHQSLQGN